MDQNANDVEGAGPMLPSSSRAPIAAHPSRNRYDAVALPYMKEGFRYPRRASMRAAIVIVAAAAGLLAPALATSSFAQTQRLPRRSPAEQQVDEINRSLIRKQQRVGNEQQNQIETNQLRQEIHRQN